MAPLISLIATDGFRHTLRNLLSFPHPQDKDITRSKPRFVWIRRRFQEGGHDTPEVYHHVALSDERSISSKTAWKKIFGGRPDSIADERIITPKNINEQSRQMLRRRFGYRPKTIDRPREKQRRSHKNRATPTRSSGVRPITLSDEEWAQIGANKKAKVPEFLRDRVQETTQAGANRKAKAPNTLEDKTRETTQIEPNKKTKVPDVLRGKTQETTQVVGSSSSSRAFTSSNPPKSSRYSPSFFATRPSDQTTALQHQSVIAPMGERHPQAKRDSRSSKSHSRSSRVEYRPPEGGECKQGNYPVPEIGRAHV